MKSFFELRENNVRCVRARPGWTWDDIRQAVRDAEMGVAYGAPRQAGCRASHAPHYRVRSHGTAFAVERIRDRHVVLAPVDLETAREFVREANAVASRQVA